MNGGGRWYSPQCGRPNGPTHRERLRDPKYPRMYKSAREYYSDEDPPPPWMEWYEEKDRFRRLPEEQRAKFEQMENEDRERYLAETAAYKPSSGWIDSRTGEYKTIVDWHGGYLPRSGVFPPVAKTEGGEPTRKKHRVASQPPWSELNAENVSVIASFLDHPRDVFSMCYACSGWKSALSDPDSVSQEAVWRPLAMTRFPHLFRSRDFDERRAGKTTFALKDTRLTLRDVFIVHDRIIAMDHEAELAMPDESNRIRREGLEEKDFMMTYVLTHYSTRHRCASQYTFGMGILETMEHDVYVPNFHNMILSTDYNSDVIEDPCRDRSTIPVLRCFLTGPGYKTVMILKFTGFDAEWGGEGYYYCGDTGITRRDDRNRALLDTLSVSGGARADYEPNDLRFDFEGDGDLIDMFTRMFHGQEEPDSAAMEGDAGVSA